MASTNHKLPILDLFAGVGGFSHALRHVAATVAYCEISQESRAVLEHNMQCGRLHAAPVFCDVTQLNAEALSDLERPPQMLTAGFPCQDISTAGACQGLDGARSSLFFEIPRLVRALPSVQHVLLENSPNIRNKGLERVLEELKACGLCHIAYGYFSARDVGALHRRTRWVCLATRSPVDLPRHEAGDLQEAVGGHDWVNEPVPRLVARAPTPRASALQKRRCGMMGNSVVPPFIACVYDQLAAALQARSQSHSQPRTQTQTQTLQAGRHSGPNGNIMVHDAVEGTVSCHLFSCMWPRNQVQVELLNDEGVVLRTKTSWNTPVHTKHNWRQNCNMYVGSRCLDTCANELFYDRATAACAPLAASIASRGRHYNINPDFISWLMGYPLGWTAAFG